MDVGQAPACDGLSGPSRRQGARRSLRGCPTLPWMSKFELPSAPAGQAGPVKAWSEPVVIPTYNPLPPDRNPMFLEKRVYQGSSGSGVSAAVHGPHLERTGGPGVEGPAPRERVPPRHGAAGDRRAHPRGPRQDQRLRLLLPPERDQAGPGRPGRTVGFRRRRVQLAAAPPAGHLHAGEHVHRGARGRLANHLVERPRSDEPAEGHARRLPASRQGVPRIEGQALQPHAATGRRFCGGRTSRRGCTNGISRSSRPTCTTWPTMRGARYRAVPDLRRFLLRRGLCGARGQGRAGRRACPGTSCRPAAIPRPT